MKIVQLKKEQGQEWEYLTAKSELKAPLVLVLGSVHLLEKEGVYEEIKALFPNGHLVFGSTCGEIYENKVSENSITITAIEFEKTQFLIKTTTLNESFDSTKIGSDLIEKFPKEGLKYIFIISEGNFINGIEFAKGMDIAAKGRTLITGGLCGDDDASQSSIVSYNEAPKKGEIVAIGFYGESLEVSFSIYGGWTPLGSERKVTKSEGNVIYELNHIPALELYKKYIGEEHLDDISKTFSLYPMKMKSETGGEFILTNISGIDEEKKALIMVRNVVEDAEVQLMMTNEDAIENACEEAAKKALHLRKSKPELAFLVSCRGRKSLLGQRVEDEIGELVEVLGDTAAICGFYAAGEIAPSDNETPCQLHNQIMIITLLSE